MKTPTLEELLKSGAHFGHKVSKWHPKMAPYIYGNKNNVHVINLEKTVECLKKVLDYVKTLASQGRIILFVATKEQSKDVIKKTAEDCGMPYVSEHWIGGLLTNFKELQKRVKHLIKLEEDKARGKLEKYTKKERLDFDTEIKKLNKMFGGVKKMEKAPDAIFIIDIKREKTALREAVRKGIPIIAVVDTNVNPESVAYPIPANDDALKSLEVIIAAIGEAVMEGKAKTNGSQKVVKEINTVNKSE